MMGNEVINVDLAFHVPVDNLGYIGTATRATKGRALPDATRYQLERPRCDLGTGFGHTDNNRLTPTAMAALQRLAHDFGVAHTLEGVIRSTIGKLDNMINDVFHLVGIHKIGHPKLASHGFALGVEVHTDDFVSTDHFGTLDDVEPNPAQAKDHHIGTRFNIRGKQHRPEPSSDPTPYIANLVKRGVFADFC